MAATPRIAVEDEAGIPVLRILDRQLLDDRVVREVGEQIDAAIPPGTPVALILDFSGVSVVSSAFLGRLVLLQRRAMTSGGVLRLCGLAPAVRDVLRTTNLDRVLTITRDRNEAREAFGPR